MFGDESRCSMRRWFVPLVFLAAIVSGCGPSASELREKTLSLLNTEADRWDGGKKFATSATDAYGHPLTCSIEKTTLDYVLEIRSNGPDGLPKNSDDIVVIRHKRHDETSLTKEAVKAVEGVSRGATREVITEIKKGLGVGGKGDKNE
jgi:hypothetical protein